MQHHVLHNLTAVVHLYVSLVPNFLPSVPHLVLRKSAVILPVHLFPHFAMCTLAAVLPVQSVLNFVPCILVAVLPVPSVFILFCVCVCICIDL